MQWAGEPPALVGFNSGSSNTSLTLPTSHTPGVLELTTTGNTGTDGRWLFRVDGSDLETLGEHSLKGTHA